jgi:Ca2+-binding EF-hand superfamily protein
MVDSTTSLAALQREADRQAPFDPQKYCIDGEVTVHEVNDMKRAFDMIDEDRSGFIDVDELTGAAIALGIPMEDNVKVLLGNNQISFDEFFYRMTAKLGRDDTVDDIMSIFELFDVDCTGTITAENLETIRNIIGASEDMPTIVDMLGMVDTDGDGHIDPIDFYTCMISGMRIRMDAEAKKRREVRDQMQQQAAEMYADN